MAPSNKVFVPDTIVQRIIDLYTNHCYSMERIVVKIDYPMTASVVRRVLIENGIKRRKPGKYVDPDDLKRHARIIRAYQNNVGPTVLAKRFGMTKNGIHRLLRRNNVPPQISPVATSR